MDDNRQDNEHFAVGNRRTAASVTLSATLTETENGNAVKSEMDMEIDEPHGGNGNAVHPPVRSLRTRATRSSDKKSNKRPIVCVVDCSGDEEEFAGFDECTGMTIFFSINGFFVRLLNANIWSFRQK